MHSYTFETHPFSKLNYFKYLIDYGSQADVFYFCNYDDVPLKGDENNRIRMALLIQKCAPSKLFNICLNGLN